MANEKDFPSDIVILPPNDNLRKKLGSAKLDEILSAEVIKKAETVISGASQDLYLDCMAASVKLQSLVKQFGEETNNEEERLGKIISTAFGIKGKAGQSGYNLVAALAKSLQIFCEKMPLRQATPAARQIIAWHAESMAQLLSLKVQGDGGEKGKSILAEIERLKTSD